MFNRYIETDGSNKEFIFANIALKNIDFALISLDYIFNHSNFECGIYHDEHTFYFFHIQSILNACGNLYDIFYNIRTHIWGDRNANPNVNPSIRSDQLRKTFGVHKRNFPTIFNKEARNTNTHFDERYDVAGYIVGDYNLLDENTEPLIRDIINDNYHLRTYDKTNFIYYTFNSNWRKIRYDLKTLERELVALRNLISGNPVTDSGWNE